MELIGTILENWKEIAAAVVVLVAAGFGLALAGVGIYKVWAAFTPSTEDDVKAEKIEQRIIEVRDRVDNVLKIFKGSKQIDPETGEPYDPPRYAPE